MRVGLCAFDQLSNEEFDMLIGLVSKIKYFSETISFFCLLFSLNHASYL